MEFLEKLMRTIIDEGVKIPKAQVERYISPILTIFLPELLSKIYSNEYTMIMPEFPIRIGRIKKGSSSNQSKNIDYLLYNKTKNIFTFLELKSDSKSFKKSQLKIYQDLQDICGEKTINQKFGMLLQEDLITIHKATRLKSKYQYILDKWQDRYNLVNDMEIIYLVPEKVKNKVEGNLVLSFNDLPQKLNLYNKEWSIIRDYLIKLDKN